MAEELKHLIKQIQKEGVDKANEEAAKIISQAKEKAAKIVAESEETAHQNLAQAKTTSEAFSERSVKTLEQAARDLLITVGQGCENVVTEVLGKEVNGALSGDLLKTMISGVVNQGTGGVELVLSENDATALTSYCAELTKKSGKEIDLTTDSEILSGFKVGFKGENVYLDYTGGAIADALAAFLRPELAKTVSAVARQQLTNA